MYAIATISCCCTRIGPVWRRHHTQLIDYLARWRLRLHPGKTAIIPVQAGLTFVGYRTWPGRREVRGSNMRPPS